ncbi:MAG: response regulator, partial [Lachnospiraceae bacterium]|nr:response regulator [Lachnospiraceae bacterium]
VPRDLICTSLRKRELWIRDRECLSRLQDEAAEVCRLDIFLAGMDGLEVLRRLKTGYPGLKVVMISALAQENNIRLALQLGADAFVVKPFSSECLIERVG